MITKISTRMEGMARITRMEEEEKKNINMDARDMQDYMRVHRRATDAGAVVNKRIICLGVLR